MYSFKCTLLVLFRRHNLQTCFYVFRISGSLNELENALFVKLPSGLRTPVARGIFHFYIWVVSLFFHGAKHMKIVGWQIRTVTRVFPVSSTLQYWQLLTSMVFARGTHQYGHSWTYRTIFVCLEIIRSPLCEFEPVYDCLTVLVTAWISILDDWTAAVAVTVY